MTRNELEEAYVQALLDSMDLDDLMVLAQEHLQNSISLYSDFELKTDIEQFYPELLEKNNE